MKLWRKVAGTVKDKNSICLAKVGSKKGFRNPDIEAAVIKATSHDESTVDYKNAQRVFDWVRTSSAFLDPLIWAITQRLEKTRNWVVALKALMLRLGVVGTKIPAVCKIGRLPFDLSSFHDRFSGPAKSWGFSAFIRAYFAFLDQHSNFLIYHLEEEEEEEEEKNQEKEHSMRRTLLRLHRSQGLLDLLLQIKPCTNGMEMGLVLEAMDCIVIEIFDVYSRICSSIVTLLAGVFSSATSEAVEALQILQKAALQSSQLSAYFQVCRDMGVMNATDLPPIEQIPEADISDLERIIRGVSGNGDLGEEGENVEEKKRIVKRENSRQMDLRNCSGTIVTENWVVFNDDSPMERSGISSSVGGNGDLNGFWQLHHHTKKLSLVPLNMLGQVSSMNQNRMKQVYSNRRM